MKKQSPFCLDRFEYESRHLYYLQDELFNRLEEPKPVYLVGSRGTGKTTLLQALNWAERRDNPWLIKKIDNDPIPKKYVGIYLKLPEIQFDVIRRWLTENEADYPIIFSFFLDLVWAEALVEALSELIVNETFEIPPEFEEAIVQKVFDNFQDRFDAIGIKPSTLKELVKAIRHLRETVEISSRRKSDPTVLISQLRIVGQVGEFGRQLGALLHPLCVTPGAAASSYKEWHFKICMDEGECLDLFQQRILNTMLRISKSPVFLVVSYVSMPQDASSTLIDNLTLQSADRELILLDAMTEKEFREMAEGVATVRIRALLEDANAKFSLQRTLGELDVNQMLSSIVRNSVSPVAKKLLKASEELAKGPYFSQLLAKNGKDSLPIYQAYLIDKLNLQVPSVSSDHWKKRKDSSAGFRKKFVAAYLSICAEINTEVRYAFAEMVLQMSDMCIRDFLHQLDAIYVDANFELEKFLTTQVPIEIQDGALKRASKDKYDSIPKSGVSEPKRVGTMIDGLARLTALVQSRSINLSHLRSSERGQFAISMESKPGNKGDLICQTIKDAAEAGFVKLIQQDRNEWRFRVHTSLAANYGFSYRGAYYPTYVEWNDLFELKNADSEKEINQIINAMVGKLEREIVPTNLSLFENIDEE